MMGYSLNSSVYILTPSLEKEKDLRYILRVMGCRTVPYWLGTFLCDFLAFQVTILAFYLIIYFVNIPLFLVVFWQIYIVLTGFSVSLIMFAYVFSFYFKTSNQAFKQFPLYSFFIFTVLPDVIKALMPSELSPYLSALNLAISPFDTFSFGNE